MENYILNNIGFRISSATALSKFKAGQAFDFNELVSMKDNFSFSSASRETLLLNYDLWFKWILKLEASFLKQEKDIMNIIMDSLRSQYISVIDIMASHPKVFTNCIIKQIGVAHIPTNLLLDYDVREVSEENTYVAFSKIVSAISKKLHRLLFELHEFEFAQRPGEEFLTFTNSSLSAFNKIGMYPTIERAKFYKEEFGVSTFSIKNYASVFTIDKSVLDILSANDINIRS